MSHELGTDPEGEAIVSGYADFGPPVTGLKMHEWEGIATDLPEDEIDPPAIELTPEPAIEPQRERRTRGRAPRSVDEAPPTKSEIRESKLKADQATRGQTLIDAVKALGGKDIALPELYTHANAIRRIEGKKTLTTRTWDEDIVILREAGRISRTGSGKATRYNLV